MNKRIEIMEHKLTKYGFDKWVTPDFIRGSMIGKNWWICGMNANNARLEMELTDITSRKRLVIKAKMDNGKKIQRIYPYKYISSITHFKKWLKKEMKVF